MLNKAFGIGDFCREINSKITIDPGCKQKKKASSFTIFFLLNNNSQ